MNIYASQGFTDFVVAAGYKAHVISTYAETVKESWRISVVDTGIKTQTAGRIKRVLHFIDTDEFMVTYGDGLGAININKLIKFHSHHKNLGTVTAVRPPARFGVLEAENGLVTNFGEKRQSDAGWINGGFFIFNKTVFESPISDTESLETAILPRLVKLRELNAFFHHDFWQPMDTLRECNELRALAKESIPPWLSIKD
jgi:glucose-1-phosphate cytidylyltransferase